MSAYRPKISLNLGAGAARGYAHIGVLRALKEHRIPFDFIIGVSMGAFIGSIYAMEPDVDFTEERALDLLDSENFKDTIVANYYNMMESEQAGFFHKLSTLYTKTGLMGRIFLSPGMLSLEEVENALFPYLPNLNIENTRFPFAAVSVDLEKGKSKIFTKGPMRPIVMSSMAMPVVFPPIEVEKSRYVDGGVLDKVGIDSAETLGIRKIIAVDVSNEAANDGMSESLVKTGVDVMLRTEEIASQYRRERQLNRATITLMPIKGNIHWADYGAAREMIDTGYEYTISRIGEIRHQLKLIHPVKKLFFFFTRNKKY